MFWTTGTTGDGAAAGYTEAQTTEFFGDMFTPSMTAGPHTAEGVVPRVLGELAVTASSGQAFVASGRMIGEGYAYKNTSALTIALPTPAANTRIDRIVLRVQHGTTRTARVTRIAGTEGAAAPALTQVAGTTWDIPLAQISVTTAGVITVTDQRSFCHFATKVNQAMLDNSAVGANQIIDGAITSVKIADGTIQTMDLANDAVDDTKVGARVIQAVARQGGDATNWGVPGATAYTPGMIRMYVGSTLVDVTGGATYADKTVTFPGTFSAIPIVLVTNAQAGSNAGIIIPTVMSRSTTGMTLRLWRGDMLAFAQTYQIMIHWLAIGPE